jgi:HEPN domain-containing protein
MTMTLHDHIQYWVKMAESDWEAAHSLLSSKHLIQSLFFFHLSIEKLLKANWIFDNGESFPPMTHHLESLYAQTEIQFSEKQLDMLKLVNTWNIEGRYQDYRQKLARSYSETYIRERLEVVQTIKACLLERLPSIKPIN